MDRCHACNGIWFDRGEMFEALYQLEKLDVNDILSPSAPHPAALYCPRCSICMESTQSPTVSSVTFERCTRCRGVWFGDEGQFELLALMIRNFA